MSASCCQGVPGWTLTLRGSALCCSSQGPGPNHQEPLHAASSCSQACCCRLQVWLLLLLARVAGKELVHPVGGRWLCPGQFYETLNNQQKLTWGSFSVDEAKLVHNSYGQHGFRNVKLSFFLVRCLFSLVRSSCHLQEPHDEIKISFSLKTIKLFHCLDSIC